MQSQRRGGAFSFQLFSLFYFSTSLFFSSHIGLKLFSLTCRACSCFRAFALTVYLVLLCTCLALALYLVSVFFTFIWSMSLPVILTYCLHVLITVRNHFVLTFMLILYLSQLKCKVPDVVTLSIFFSPVI